MKNPRILTLLFLTLSITIGAAQTKKPTTKKPTTTVKSTPSKTTTTQKTTTTTTTTPVAVPPVVQEKKTTTTETRSQTTPSSTTTTTTTTQSSGPTKNKNNSQPSMKEPKPKRVRESKTERVKELRLDNNGTNISAGGIRLGIRAEATQLLSFEEGGQPDFSPGFNAGLIVNFPLSRNIAIQPEILYSMASIKATNPISAKDFVRSTSSSVLAPVTVNFNLGNGSTKFMVNPGGYMNYLLVASASQSVSGVTESAAIDLTGVDKLSYGAVLGLGVKINGIFLVEVRSFYDLKESNNKSIFSTVGIGYMF